MSCCSLATFALLWPVSAFSDAAVSFVLFLGGCWILKVRKGNGVITRLWEELCFACVGEWISDPAVQGISLATRVKDDTISVWLLEPSRSLAIGERLKNLLNLDESTVLYFQPFDKAIKAGSTSRGAQEYKFVAAVQPAM